jgi:signal peptidase II
MRVFWISAVVLVVDQLAKAAVLEYMHLHQSIPILGDWLKLTFTENPGMAFGIAFGPPGTVTVLSILATGLVIAYIYQVRNTYTPYRASLAFILGGALGNIIDRVFYGELLGYGSLFTGRVVDFIHVSLWQGFIPDPVPLIGGAYMELFPIWNVADMAIVLGVVGVLSFHHIFHQRLMEQHEGAAESGADASPEAAPEETTAPSNGADAALSPEPSDTPPLPDASRPRESTSSSDA